MPTSAHMGARRLSGIVAAVVVATTVASAWAWSATNPILPGISGCGWVREVQPRIDCLEERIEDGVAADGVERTAARVDALVSDRAIGQECHLAWHPAGERRGAAAAARGDGVARLESSSWCTQGYDHGFLVGYLGHQDARPDSAAMAQLCHAVASEGTINCVHAFGHAFARTSDGDLDDAWHDCAVEPAGVLVDDADRTADELRLECMSGAAMEVAIIDRAAGVGRTARSDCAGLGPEAGTFCAGYATVRASLLGDERTDDEVCSSTTDDATLRRACLRQAGR